MSTKFLCDVIPLHTDLMVMDESTQPAHVAAIIEDIKGEYSIVHIPEVNIIEKVTGQAHDKKKVLNHILAVYYMPSCTRIVISVNW